MAYRPYIWRKNNPEKRWEQKRREKIRRNLRNRGIFPPVGEEMNEEQKLIDSQISNNNFSYWDSIKSHNGCSGFKQSKTKLKSPEYLIWYRNKWKEKERNIPFNITVDDIKIPETCEITGEKLLTDILDNHKDGYYVLARIDYNKGFEKDNIRVISRLGLDKLNIQTGGKCYLFDYEPKDTQSSIYERAKNNAKKNNHDFDLEIKDIDIPTNCPYLNIELVYNKKYSKYDNYFSIDRIDSSKGYVKGNIQVISKLANTMKNNATTEQLITFAKNILKIHNT